jgi:hypothetical protein
MRNLLLVFLAVSTGCPDDPEEGTGADTGGTTDVSSTGMSGSASTSSTTGDPTTDPPATSSESGDPGSTTSEGSSSGGSSNVECEWYDQVEQERSWGRCSPRLTWQGAEDHCVSEGGHLASIASGTEGIFASNILLRADEAWIGLNDRETPDTWEWTDGTPYDYTNWDTQSGQPDNPDHDCVAIGITRRWFDYACNEDRIFICIRPL